MKDLFANQAPEINEEGKADVTLGNRTFTIKKQFLEDIDSQNVLSAIGRWRGSLLVMHSPLDATVGIEHAGEIYSAAKHPKSFLSLDPADHLLTKSTDSQYVADMIGTWATRFVESPI